MAAATIFDVEHSTVHPDILPRWSCNTSFLGLLMMGSPFLELFVGYMVNVKVKQGSNDKFGSKIITIFVSLQSATSHSNRFPALVM